MIESVRKRSSSFLFSMVCDGNWPHA